jgi:hypothetical protein
VYVSFAQQTSLTNPWGAIGYASGIAFPQYQGKFRACLKHLPQAGLKSASKPFSLLFGSKFELDAVSRV